MKIFCNMIVGCADKRVSYNTLWERSVVGGGGGGGGSAHLSM